MKELQSLGLDVKILSGDKKEIDMKDFEDDDDLQQTDALNLQTDANKKESEKVGVSE